MKLHYFLKLLLLAIFFTLIGCASAPTIDYPLGDIEQSDKKQLKEISLEIRPFEDIRRSLPESAILFPNEKYEKPYQDINGIQYCINSEDQYSEGEKGSVPSQIASIIAQHLEKRGAFKYVSAISDKSDQLKENRPADLYLTGTLKKLYGQQVYSTTQKAAGIAFGIIGTLATIGSTSPLKIEIEITDLAIYKNGGQLLTKIEDVNEKFEEDATDGGFCRNIYNQVNIRLKKVIDDLAEKIENKIADNSSQ